MNTNRRQFLKTATMTLGATGLFEAATPAAEKKAPKEPKPVKYYPILSKPSKYHLGIVTYNIAEDWDIGTIIKNCTEAKFEGVELRTGHKHGVEVTLSKDQRAEVGKRFADSPVKLWSLGSAFEFHMTDQAKLRASIDATKEYIVLAKDVGATGVKVRPNGLPKEVPVEKTLEQIGRSLHELGEFADNLGLQVRLEVHGSGTANVPYCRTIMDVADRKNVGVCWNSNQSDMDGDGWDHNFNLLKDKIFTVHLRDIYLEDYPFRKLFVGLAENRFTGFTFAEIPPSADPVRVMKYFRSLWLAYQGLL